MKRLLAVLLFACATAGWAQTPATPHPGSMHDEGVDAHIQELHAELKITPAEETQWAQVADAIRTSAKSMDDLIQARHDNASKQNAVENLRSWTEIAQAHADGSKAVLAAFEPLYQAMSDTQRKLADEVFRRHPSNQHEQ